jgi:hypothetical protein
VGQNLGWPAAGAGKPAETLRRAFQGACSPISQSSQCVA